MPPFMDPEGVNQAGRQSEALKSLSSEAERLFRAMAIANKEFRNLDAGAILMKQVAQFTELVGKGANRSSTEMKSLVASFGAVGIAGAGALGINEGIKGMAKALAYAGEQASIFANEFDTGPALRLQGELKDVTAEAGRLGLVGKEAIGQLFSAQRGPEIIGTMRSILQAEQNIKNASAAGLDITKATAHFEDMRGRFAAKTASAKSAIAAAEIEGRRSGAPQGATEMAKLAGGGNIAAKAIMSLGSSFKRLGEAEKLAAGPGAVQMGAGMSMISSVLGGLASKLVPLISMGSIYATIALSIIEVLDLTRRVGGKSGMALNMSGTQAAKGMETGWKDSLTRIRLASGLTLTQIGAMAGAFTSEVLPAAQDAMLSFGGTFRNNRDDIYAWTGALAGVAVQGKAFGMDYGKSIGIAVTATKAFGLSNSQLARDAFTHFAMGMQRARMSADDFASAIGDVVDLGKRWGDQSNIYESMGKMMGGLNINNVGQKLGLASAAMDLTKNLPKLVGMGTYAMGPGGSQAKMLQNIVNAANHAPGSKDMLGVANEALWGSFNQMGGAKLLGSKNINDRFQGSMMAATASGQEWIQTAALVDDKFSKALMEMSSGRYTKENMDVFKTMQEEMDETQKGINAISSQTGYLEVISKGVSEIVSVLASNLFTSPLVAMHFRHAPQSLVPPATDKNAESYEQGVISKSLTTK